jgi:hypothetical protein
VAETIDCLNLAAGSNGQEPNSFFDIPLISTEDSQFIFDLNYCLLGSMFFEDKKIKPGKIYFFGGNSSGKPNKSNSKKVQVEGSPLYELVIVWNEKNEPIQAEIKLVKRPDGSTVIFPG